ncbi:MAG: glycine--tRNA ligase [Candidatus Yanofskybacteria bacterium RIFCSPHIGHO2_01_FULL_45_42]|uniref:Glycine--tRNA ligase n=2 Tax=Candidatus Yanofskyibacteriota TaxID=1752733 RepID=A0A1F8FU26_9BACT|nr:MAG: glycine--tRNA ligase [Candidatus Yanofskybacteria bacterium RIFCSPHIGHO2_01_FULL_45_42]OGN15956.1 MAG: glycine--tRNA ligase [Candidatus Yanofskybacteria bacterium RIFCSPHIGHO2_02_FULL_43_22]
MADKLEKIVSLCKRRGFIFPGSEIYGGLANSWDYGPLGTELKKNIKDLWWVRFVSTRDDIVGIDAALLMNTKVWKASEHLDNFVDLLIECRKCQKRFRAEDLGYIKDSSGSYIISKPGENPKCPNCGFEFGFVEPEKFNTMIQTFLGPVDPINKLFTLWLQFQKSDKHQDRSGKEIIAGKIDDLFEEIKDTLVFFRPETAQAMFVDFKNVLDTTRKTIPFGIAQIGKAFRNEITPGNFIFRTREFEQMEIEYFVEEANWEEYFEYWRKQMLLWLKDIGINPDHIHEFEVPEIDRAHYSKRTIDFEYEFPFGRKELYGLAYRGDFDLKNHYKEPPYRDPESNEEFWPHVIEPTWGVDRTILAVLLDAYNEDDKRVVLKLHPRLAPYKAAVFPLVANKLELVSKAREIYQSLVASRYSLGSIAWDDRGNIGKRYYSQDEIGTPYCVTIDYQTLEDGTVTVRDRDTAKQERISVDELGVFVAGKLK